MNVSAFIRNTSNKNKATIYIRVRDEDCDMKAATELSINPSYWDPTRQGYKPRVSLVRDDDRQQLNNAVNDLKKSISQTYYKGADSQWLKQTIFVFHHPEAYKLRNGKKVDTRLASLIEEYIKDKGFEKLQAVVVRSNVGKIERFEKYKQVVGKHKNYTMNVDTITEDDLDDLYTFLVGEHELVNQYPALYKGVGEAQTQPRSDNTLRTVFSKLRTVMNWAGKKGITTNRPFDFWELPEPLYGDPYFLTIDERNQVAALDLSSSPHLAMFRDVFVFQCFTGPRYSDLFRITAANIIDGALEYVPQKTRNHDGRVVRVPLHPQALAIYEKFKGRNTKALFPRYCVVDYNKGIRTILQMAGVNRMVSVINPLTRKDEVHPISEIATSHTGRKTFIGNLYKQVQDPNLIASMSGHVNGSKAFARYRHIDDEMKRGLVDMIS